MAERFYLNSSLEPGFVVLRGPEAHHLAAVSRLRSGDPVCLFNGDGHDYHGRVAEVSKRDVSIEIQSVEDTRRELPYRIVVATAVPKGDRAQFLIEKLTELGVAAFIPLETRRSVVHPGESKLDKLQRWVIEASKQCGRNVLMHIEAVCPWERLVAREDLPASRMVAHPGTEVAQRMTGDVVLAVGPEGGFTDAEIGLAQASGWRAVALGPRILRIETAAIALAARWALGDPGQ